MTADWTTFGSNIVSMLVGGAALYTGLVRPQRDALRSALKQLQEYKDSRMAERLAQTEHELAAIQNSCQQRPAARLREQENILSFVRHLVDKSDLEARAGRKHLHEDIANCRNEITKLGANFGNLEGWLKTVDERLDQKTTELIAAVANAAGRSGN